MIKIYMASKNWSDKYYQEIQRQQDKSEQALQRQDAQGF